MKKLILFLTIAFAIGFFSSCENHITDGEGTVIGVRKTSENDQGSGFKRTYRVTIEVKNDDVTYVLYTNQTYTVGGYNTI